MTIIALCCNSLTQKHYYNADILIPLHSRINHPYLRQWAKECTHLENSDIISYLIAALVPISYLPDRKGPTEQTSPQTTNGDTSKEKEEEQTNADRQGVKENGEDVDHTLMNHTQDGELNVASLHLDPLPQSASPVHQTANGGAVEIETNPPDPKTLKLAPLPPLRTESMQQLTTNILTQLVSARPDKTDGVASSAGDSSSVPAPSHTQAGNENGPVPKTEPHEVINDEFGVQELSVFAVNPDAKPTTTVERTLTSTAVTHSPLVSSSPSKLITSTRSAFTPVMAPSSLAMTTPNQASSPLKAGPPQTNPSKTQSETSVPDLASAMDSVSLGEFADAFMQGDTTNWYQRMRLLDHIEGVQEKVSLWMDSLEQQLEGGWVWGWGKMPW